MHINKLNEDVLSQYVLQTFNLFSFMDENSLMRFSDQLTDDEYLLFDYLTYQGCSINEAANKIEFSLAKTYRLLGIIKCKGLLFFASNQNVFLSKDRIFNISVATSCELPARVVNANEELALSA